MSDEEAAPKPGGKKKKMMMGAAAAVVAVAGYMYMAPATASTEKPKPKPGEVVVGEPMHINLADGHFLKLQIALQIIEGPAHAPDESAALDAAIDLFSGQDVAEVSSPKGRHKFKDKLRATLDKIYHHDVMDVYFTQYVVQ